MINPRGFRTGSVRQDTFFQALPLILERSPNITFACAAMAGQREALRWVERLRLEGKVHLLPLLPQADLWELFARAAVTVSVSQHDGTPNSLLEAMALGAFPVAGDIESIREWITPGVNGLLVEPDKPQALAEAVLLALDNPDLRRGRPDATLRWWPSAPRRKWCAKRLRPFTAAWRRRKKYFSSRCVKLLFSSEKSAGSRRPFHSPMRWPPGR